MICLHHSGWCAVLNKKAMRHSGCAVTYINAYITKGLVTRLTLDGLDIDKLPSPTEITVFHHQCRKNYVPVWPG